MDEKRIWAPWRLGYVAGDFEDSSDSSPLLEPTIWRDGADDSCFVCRAAATYEQTAAAQRQNLVVAANQHTLVILNRYPYTNGHLLVVPLRHVGEISDLSPDEHLEAMQSLSQMTELLKKLVKAEGFNIGLNLGRVAGAGVPGHLHWHLVPRWSGDNNFMPTLAGTRMIPQSLDAMREAIVEAMS